MGTIRTKSFTATTTASGLVGCGMLISDGIIFGVQVISGGAYRCVPIIAVDGSWVAIVLSTDNDQTAAPNTELRFTAYYIET